MKAGDISDQAMLAAIQRDTRLWGMRRATTRSLAEREGWPWKVASAKLRKMQRRGLVDGCACGCRGDWTIVDRT